MHLINTPLLVMTDVKALGQQFRLVSRMPDVHVYFPDKQKPYLWHVSFMGSDDSPFSEGIYHISFDFTNYPKNGPTVVALNENGGFSVGQALCIVGITSGNSSTWTPGTQIPEVIDAIRSYMSGSDRSGMGVMNPMAPAPYVRAMAQQSRSYVCRQCGCDHAKLAHELRREQTIKK